MKTAISIPDAEFEDAEKLAKRLNMGRSEVYRKAIADFVSRHAESRVTERLNEIYSAEDSGSTLDEDLRCLQAKSIPKERW
jgi:predicted transcriptional regulator